MSDNDIHDEAEAMFDALEQGLMELRRLWGLPTTEAIERVYGPDYADAMRDAGETRDKKADLLQRLRAKAATKPVSLAPPPRYDGVYYAGLANQEPGE